MKAATWRLAGTGGGGAPGRGGIVPYFCKRCGKTVQRSQAMQDVDICKRCRRTK